MYIARNYNYPTAVFFLLCIGFYKTLIKLLLLMMMMMMMMMMMIIIIIIFNLLVSVPSFLFSLPSTTFNNQETTNIATKSTTEGQLPKETLCP